MEHKICLIIFCAILAFSNASTKLPAGIIPCKTTDPKFDECVLKSAQYAIPFLAKGNPKFGLPPMDPMHISEVLIEDNGNSGLYNMNVKVKDMYIHGLGATKIKKININTETGEISWTGLIPHMEVFAEYSGSGKIMSITNQGQGDMNATIVNTECTHTFRLVQNDNKPTKKGDEKNYVTPVDTTCECIPSDVIVDFRNLFPGRRDLEERMNNFLNNNWKVFHNEFGVSLSQVFKKGLDNIVTKITDVIPLEMLFPEIK